MHRTPSRVAIALSAASLLAVPGFAAAHDSRHGHHGKKPVKLDILAINDFHGQLEKVPATSSSGRVALPTTPPSTVPAGGAEYLATHLDRLRAAATAKGAYSVTVAAGDLIGATPLLSAAFHDEPTIEAMNMMGLEISSVGNHEFDEGYLELLRMQRGGCIDDGTGVNNQNSCPDPAAPFPGASFRYLAANVKYAGTNRTILPSYTIKKYKGIKVGFIGMTLEQTPDIVTKAGIEGLDFKDEVETVNALVPKLRRKGVKAIVVLLHQGGQPADTTQYNACAGVTGPGVDIAQQLHPAIDVVIAGHVHQAYNCTVTDPAGKPRLLTSAMSIGRLVTTVSVQLDRRTHDIVRSTAVAQNNIVTNTDVPARADITSLIAKYKGLVAVIASRVIGQVDGATAVTRTADANGGDSSLGNLIADAQKADASTIPAGGTAPVIALMNPGGIRADLLENAAGDVTFEAAFSVQPFNNYDVSMNLTGQQVLDVLNQQWNGLNASSFRILQVSGLSYTWSLAQAQAADANGIVGTVMVDADGNPATPMVALDPAATYRVVVNSFLSDGGDGFSVLAAGTSKYFGGLDIDAFATYLTAHSPVAVPATDRISQVP